MFQKSKTANLLGLCVAMVMVVTLFGAAHVSAQGTTYTLTVLKTGLGTGTVSGTGIDCGLARLSGFDQRFGFFHFVTSGN